MPTSMRFGPYRFFFFSADGDEPVHIHVESSDGEAKFWLLPVRMAYNRGLRQKQLRQIRDLLEQHQNQLVENWNEFFDR